MEKGLKWNVLILVVVLVLVAIFVSFFFKSDLSLSPMKMIRDLSGCEVSFDEKGLGNYIAASADPVQFEKDNPSCALLVNKIRETPAASFNTVIEETQISKSIPGWTRGDTNCDGVINFADINPFVLALSNQQSYQNQFPNCNLASADINCDGVSSYADINPFVNCITQGVCAQCPADVCGNNIAEESEQCDNLDLKNETCSSFDYNFGNLTCNSGCTLNMTGCSNSPEDLCGNGVIDDGELCDIGLDHKSGGMDDVLDPYNNDCFSYPRFDAGEMKCYSNCYFYDMNNCTRRKTGVLPGINQTGNILVVYNVNDLDSYDIARYYADMRGIPETRLCGVQLPDGQFATAAQMLGARKTIIESCVCNAIHETVPNNNWPTPCTVQNIDAISTVSPITFITFIKGMPIRLTETNWTEDAEEPPLQFYLANFLYYNGDIFNNGRNGYFPMNYYTYTGRTYPYTQNQTFYSWYGYIRRIIPRVDKIVAYGLVEAMDKDRTYNLIYRTLKAEKQGIKGNLLYSFPNPTNLPFYELYRDVSESHDPICLSYYQNSSAAWPYSSCRLGVTQGEVPGTDSSQVPRAINAFYLYWGNMYYLTQPGFNNFDTMLNYHKSQYNCIELCKDMGSDEAINECRRKSKDYFKELNTDCVGVADGFIDAGSCCSWAVQFYGFYPTGWGMTSGGNGNYEKTAPLVMNGGAFMNSKFKDNKYLHFGSRAIANPVCTFENGSVESCKQLVPINLLYTAQLNSSVSSQGTKNLNLVFRHRNPATQGAKLTAYLLTYWSDGSPRHSDTLTYDMSSESNEWKTESATFTILTPSGVNLSSVSLYVASNFSTAVKGWLDLDAFELIDNATGLDVLPDKDGVSFNKPFIGQTTAGDWAANVIDRLSGIIAWGSSSHFITEGVTCGGSDYSGAFFSGRTFGESLANSVDTWGFSTLIYGDPLYNPSGAKLYLQDGIQGINYFYNVSKEVAWHYNFLNDSYAINSTNKNWPLKVNAFHGSDNYLTTHWNISVCRDSSYECFEGTKNWTTVYSENHAVFEYEAPVRLVDLVSNPNVDQTFFVRLRVWNPGDEGSSITSYASFKSAL